MVNRHIPFYREVFAIPGFLAEPFMSIGFQDIIGKNIPDDFLYPDLNQYLRARGVEDITTLDLFDERADMQHDLNHPVPNSEEEKYQTVFDIGSLEHIFDTKQCMENCMRMVRPGGYYFLHTPVRGYERHGFHTFDPELIISALRLNRFEIDYLKYSTGSGRLVEQLEDMPGGLPGEQIQVLPQNTYPRVLIWIVGRKTASLETFRIPQQGLWARQYAEGT